MPSNHALLSPSAAARWTECPPSVRLNEKFIDRFGAESSEYAEEGTKAHALAELKLRFQLDKIDMDTFYAGVTALGDIPEEMQKATDFYMGLCLERFNELKEFCPDAQILIEQRLDLTPWAPECWGTGDCIIVSDTVLNVIDFKYGKGVPVSAANNPQARCYGLGAVHEFGDLYGFDDVVNTIVQPRLESVSDEALTRSALLEWGEWLRPKALMAYNGEGEFQSGLHCKFCPVKAICAKRIADSLQLVEAGLAPPETMDDQTIAGIYKALPLIKDWVSAFEEYVQKQALRGQKIEGFKLVRGKRPARTFKDPAAVKTFLEHDYSIPPEAYLTDPSLKSVAQIEKALGRKRFVELLEDKVVQGEGALTLVPEDDPREAYDSAAADFKDLE